VAVFRKAKACCGEMETSGCCHDEKVDVKADAFKVSTTISNTGFVPVLIAEISFPILDFSTHFQNSSNHFIAQLDKDRPPDDSDIVILVQSFLI